MIDWITMVLPFKHRDPIKDGSTMKLNKHDDIKFITYHYQKFKGSFESGIQAHSEAHTRDHNGIFHTLKVSGNPTKLFQGHNVFGTNDLYSLVVDTYYFLLDALNLEPHPEDEKKVLAGEVYITKVDINESFQLKNLNECLAWIRAAEHSVRMRHRGKGVLKGDTLYLGLGSTYSSFKFYAKGQEVRDNIEHQPALLNLPKVIEYSDTLLRAESVIFSRELKKRNLNLVSQWCHNDIAELLFSELLSKVEMSDKLVLTTSEVSNLPPRLQGVYELWKSGKDLRSLYAKNTFYRYRRELLNHGIDISVKQPEKLNNVIPLIRVLEAIPASIPDWAHGTNLYYEAGTYTRQRKLA